MKPIAASTPQPIRDDNSASGSTSAEYRWFITVRPGLCLGSGAERTLSGLLASRFARAAMPRGTNTVAIMISTPQVFVKSATDGGVAPGAVGSSIEAAKV